MTVKHQPEGMQTVIPYLIVEDAGAELDFAAQVFDGEIIERMEGPGGAVMHGEVRIGDSVVMLGAAQPPERPALPAMCYVYVPDCDATYAKALAAGATSTRDPADQFYGDRNAGVRSPSGVEWWIGTHVEDVPPDEMQRRAAEQMQG